MSLINKMLQDLDRRQALSGTEDEVPPPQVKSIPSARPSRGWFWRVFAALMAVSLGCVLWVAYELYPRPLVIESALKPVQAAIDKAPKAGMAAADSAASKPAPPVSLPAPAKPAPPPQVVAMAGAEDDKSQAAALRPTTAAPALEKPRAEALQFTKEISTPIPELPREVAKKKAQPKVAASLPREERKPVAAMQPAPAASAPPRKEPAPKAQAELPVAKLNLDVPPARVIAPPVAQARVEKRDRGRSPAQLAEAEFRRGASLINQGRISEAEEALLGALQSDPAHASARQALVALLLERRRTEDARRALQEGLAIDPRQTQFASVLARILIERRNFEAALEVLAPALEGAPGDAELHALRGAALQRLTRHKEAAQAYEASARLAPHVGATWLGLAISLEALERRPEAAATYRRAIASGSLGPEVKDYAEQRVRQLQ